MPYVRFFEQAFEWEHIVYFFYPYFWGWKPAWNGACCSTTSTRSSPTSSAPARRASSSRYGQASRLRCSTIWKLARSGTAGRHRTSPSSLYVPIVKEIQEATASTGRRDAGGRPVDRTASHHAGPPAANDDLPAWQKVGEDWQPAN